MSGSCAASRTYGRPTPQATFRSSFILGYPGETERDHDLLLEFLDEAQLDWAGFFPFSNEAGTYAAGLGDQVPPELALERLRECAELQDAITAAKRDRLIGEVRTVLVDTPGRGRTVHEAPEIDGVVHLPRQLPVGGLVDVRDHRRGGPRPARHPRRPSATRRPPAPGAGGSTRVSDAAHEHPAGHPGFTFGPSALVTPANAVTVARLLAAPVYVVMLVVWGASWINVVVGIILAGSDGLDGYMARRHGTTRSGAFLDPLADKACRPRRPLHAGGTGPSALAAGHPHHHPRGRHAALPLVGRPARRVHPRPQVGQAQDAGAGLRHRHGDHPAAGRISTASSWP